MFVESGSELNQKNKKGWIIVMKKIFVILPCYNEEENIESLINEWVSHRKSLNKKQYDLEVIGIDDCSTDSTKQKIINMTKKHDCVLLEAHEKNKGLCGGLNTAVKIFLEKGSDKDLMVLMDGDNTHNPKYIFDMLDELDKDKDCIIASRYCKNSDVVGVAKHRKFMSDGARIYYKFMLKVPNVEDYTCGYRVYKYDIIKKLVAKFGADPMKEKSFACMMEFLYKLYICGAKFGETGFELRYDNKLGESKMRVFKTMKNSLLATLKLRKLRKKNGN